MSRDAGLLASLSTAEANYPSSTPTPTIVTPPSGNTSPLHPTSRRASPFRPGSVKARVSPPLRPSTFEPPSDHNRAEEGAGDTDPESEEGEMGTRPPLHRPTDGRSGVPLLKDERGRPSYDLSNGAARPDLSTRKSTFRSRSPDMEGSSAVRKKYTYAAFFLLLSLVSFVIQTETAVYIQHELKWNKAYAML